VITDVQIEQVPAEARKVDAAYAAVRDQVAREQIPEEPKPAGLAKRRSS
jgi:hypothetical protein